MKNISILLKILSASILTSPYTFNNGDILSRLQNSPSMTAEVSELVEQPLFKDIGRMSRAIAKINELLLLEKRDISTIESLLDRLVGFSYNAYFDWDRYLMAHSSSSMTAGKSL